MKFLNYKYVLVVYKCSIDELDFDWPEKFIFNLQTCMFTDVSFGNVGAL